MCSSDLCENGNDVTVVEMLDKIGKNVYVQHYLDAMDKLSKFDITYKESSRLLEIKEQSIIVEDVNTKETTEIPADYVVLSLGVQSVNGVEEVCEAVSDKVIVVGDAQKPGRIESAIRTAFEAAYNL